MMPDPVLLVDDEADLRQFLKEALNQDGYRVEDAPDAATALELMGRRHFPVVITDLNMPGGPSGFQLIEAVKALDPLTLCVVVTGFASMEAAIKAVKYGAYDFVQKPFKLEEIEAVLDRALDHAAVLDQLRNYQRDLEDRVVARVKELKDFHEEVLRLNDLLVASQREQAEAPIFAPFVAHLRDRLGPAECLALLPTPGDGWEIQGEGGPRPWAAAPGGAAPPPPSVLLGPVEWHGPGCPEGYLVPLRSGELLLGAVYLGFKERRAFQLEDPAFVLWRRQLEAALHGLRRTRELAGALRSPRA
jgi:two-component system NtrC family response regulator/two-component system response regulator PilR (NtrC family)